MHRIIMLVSRDGLYEHHGAAILLSSEVRRVPNQSPLLNMDPQGYTWSEYPVSEAGHTCARCETVTQLNLAPMDSETR